VARVSAEDLRRFEEGAALRRVRMAIERPRDTLKSIGLAMVSESQRSFDEQAFGGSEWDARMNPNIPGIIRDLEEGKTPPERRFRDRAALVDTGSMRRAIAEKVHGDAYVEVGVLSAQFPHAALLNFGGPDSWTLSRKAQQAAVAWLRRLKTSNRERYDMLWWMGEEDNVGVEERFEHPPRPFIGLTDQTIKDVEQMIGVQIKRRGS